MNEIKSALWVIVFFVARPQPNDPIFIPGILLSVIVCAFAALRVLALAREDVREP